MVVGVPESRLEVFHPGSSGEYPDVIVPGSKNEDADLIKVTAGLRLSQRKDEGKMTAWNQDGQYTEPRDSEFAGQPLVHSGDRIDFYIRNERRDEQERHWVAWVRDVERKRSGPASSKIEWSVEDFVFGVMSTRKVYNAFENKPISGSEDAILNTCLRNEAPEIDRSLLGSCGGVTTSINCDGTTLLDLAQTLVRRADASMRGEGTALRFQSRENYPRYAPEKRELSGVENKTTDDGMINDVRVRGGQGRAKGESQTVQTGYAEFSQANPVMFQVASPKSTIDRIQLWMNRQVDEGNVTVRLQRANDENTGPVDPDNTDADIVSKDQNYEFIDYNGFTPFDLDNQVLPEPRPWVIVQTDKDDVTQRIGVNDAGAPTYIVEYPYPVLVQNGDYTSQQRYRQREATKEQNEANTEEEALEIAREVIDHDSVPESSVKFSAISKDVHQYLPGDIVELDYWREGIIGDYVITERSDTFENGQLKSDFTAQEASTV